MMRQDGDYQIYRLQHKRSDEQWGYSSLDHFVLHKEQRAIERPFTASGECWQRTGVMGSFVFVEALAFLRAMSEKYHGTYFRIVLVSISQKTEPVAEGYIAERPGIGG